MVDSPPPRAANRQRLVLLAAFAAVAVATTALLVVFGSGRVEEVHDVKLFAADDELAATPDAAQPLRVLIASMISPNSTLDMYEGLVNWLGAQVGRRAVLVQRRNYAEANEALRHGDVDVAFVCSGAFVESERDGGYADLLVTPVVRGQRTYHAVLLVGAASAYQRLEDLQGHAIAFVDVISLTGHVWLRAEVRRRHADGAGFFGRTVFTGSHDRSVDAVALGLVDAAIVDELIFVTMVEQDPTLGARLRVIERSGPFGAPPVVVPAALPLALRDALHDALVGMHRAPAGKQLLDVLHVDRFEVADPRLYDGVRALWGR